MTKQEKRALELSRMDARIQYNEEFHRYYIDGHIAPSVTEIIDNMFKDYQFNGRKLCIPSFMNNMKLAADFGTKIHDMTDLYDRKVLTVVDIQKLEEKERTHMEGWINFLHDFKLEIATVDNIFMSEYLVYSLIRKYAGRFDRICREKKTKKLVMVDIKCTYEIPVTVGLQTAGYTYAWEEMHSPHKIYKRMCCQLTGEGSKKYGYSICEDKMDMPVFLAKLTSLQWDKAHGK